MKLSSHLLSVVFAMGQLTTSIQALTRGQFLPTLATQNQGNNLRKLQMDKKKQDNDDDDEDDEPTSAGGTDGSSSSNNPVVTTFVSGSDECVICTPENKNRPLRLVLKYYGGPGQISKYQDGEKATCRDQDFPLDGIMSAYNVEYSLEDGLEFEITAPGDKFDAETDFTFSDGNECYIHTSCSQPIVAGDRIGPFLILEGNDCVYDPAYCGDGNVDEGEECDDGNNADGDGCRADCTLPECGDGIVDTEMGEECDMNVPECRDDCTLPRCGDGIVDTEMGEECDMNVPECRDDCTLRECGDGIVDTEMGEECDMNVPECRDDCTLPRCGDGIVDTEMGEECDMNVPECRDDCTLPVCGDGIVDTEMGEECDDGNNEDGDGCQANCKLPFCGDGILDVGEGEECDDGNNEDGDGCQSDCKFCVCEASAAYNANTGAVTIDYEYCDVEPVRYDFIGIYPCETKTLVGSQEWWDGLCLTQLAACGEMKYGYVDGQTYVDATPTWWTYTCGTPGTSTCQQDLATAWPSRGTVTIDPNVVGAEWAFGELGPGGRESRALAPGCYKVLMNREISYISAPPYPTICADWGSAIEFQVS